MLWIKEKLDKPIANLTKGERKTQLNNLEMKSGRL